MTNNETNDATTEFMLTTFDNPFNPFDDFESWWKNDILLGHDCCGLLARTANISSVASDEVNESYVRAAMDQIVKDEPTTYRKVSRADYEPPA